MTSLSAIATTFYEVRQLTDQLLIASHLTQQPVTCVFDKRSADNFRRHAIVFNTRQRSHPNPVLFFPLPNK
jgi:hypothetical protein